MLCVFEIGALIVGIIMLVKGEVKLTSKGVRRGPGIRVAGAILLVPLPLAFGVGLCYGAYVTAQGKQVDHDVQMRLTLVELALNIFCLALACIVAATFSERKRPRRKRYADDLDWEDERPRRRRRREFEDDDGYEEDRLSSRSRDFEDDEEEERPRRRRRRVEEDF